jgi:AcrR family transcriptional regulator
MGMPTSTWDRLPTARRDAVIAAAEAEFGAQGFSRGSLNVIAREAGVSKGSLFQYFADKADLCAYLSDIVSVRIRAHIEARTADLPWDTDFFGALRRLGHVWVRYYARHPLELSLTAAANLELDADSRGAVRGAVNRHYIEVLGPLIERGHRSGQLAADADTDAFLALLMLVLPHLVIAAGNPELDALLGLGRGTVADGERAVDRLMESFRRGFGAV